MRKKELKLVVTFHTTTDAMAMEKACKEAGLDNLLVFISMALSFFIRFKNIASTISL